MAGKELGFCGLPMHGPVILGKGQQQHRAQGRGSSVCRFLDGAGLIHTRVRGQHPAAVQGLHPQTLGSPRADVFANIHHFSAQHGMVFSVFSKPAFNPQTPTALLLRSTRAILTSAHTDSHRIRRTTAFTM